VSLGDERAIRNEANEWQKEDGAIGERSEMEISFLEVSKRRTRKECKGGKSESVEAHRFFFEKITLSQCLIETFLSIRKHQI